MKTVDFSGIIEAFDLKVGSCRQLIDFMKVCEYQRSRSFLCHIFPGFVCFVLYLAKISGERLQDHWSSGSAYVSQRLIGELIGYPRSGVRRSSSSSVRPQFQTSSPLKPLGQSKPNFIWSLLGKGE